ncbi:class I SAM-dependent methyltransferase [Candidatus Daviesbacteria bacterium]|nr:class I SAM-dependent methyltransferase [Candidatus Daviesbacteria bacterium]
MGDGIQNTESEKLGTVNKIKDAVSKLNNEFQHGLHNEYIWPIFSLVAFLKPLHNWVTSNRAKIEKGDKVLEIGAGAPFYKTYSNRVGEDGIFISLDINPNIQKRSKRLGYWLDNVLKRKKHDTLVVANADKLPFANSSFDVVIASNFTGSDKYINESFRVLKPGGRFVTAFLEPLIDPRVSQVNARICSEAGFVDVRLRPGLPAMLPLTVAAPLIDSSLTTTFAVTELISLGVGWNWDVVAKKPESPSPELNSKVSISGV